jgi:hypothetical protein
MATRSTNGNGTSSAPRGCPTSTSSSQVASTPSIGRMRASGVALIAVAALACIASASAGPGDPKRAIVAGDQKHAEAMLIRQSDVPRGFTATTSPIPGLPYCAALDESDLTVTGEATSPSFRLEVRPGAVRYSVQAQARVFRSATDALASWRRRTSSAGERCFRKALAAAMLKDGVVLRSLTRIRISSVAPRIVAYRVASTIRGSGVPPARVSLADGQDAEPSRRGHNLALGTCLERARPPRSAGTHRRPLPGERTDLSSPSKRCRAQFESERRAGFSHGIVRSPIEDGSGIARGREALAVLARNGWSEVEQKVGKMRIRPGDRERLCRSQRRETIS